MKKDILVLEVSDVYMAVVREFNHVYNDHDWNVYIINDKMIDLELVLILSRGFLDDKETSVMRHKLDKLPAKSYAKVELLQEEVLALNNSFKVTFFEEQQMMEKTFLFRKNTINLKALQKIPLMQEKGVLVK